MRHSTDLSRTGGWSKAASTLRGYIKAEIYAGVFENLLRSSTPSQTLIKKSLSLSICSTISIR